MSLLCSSRKWFKYPICMVSLIVIFIFLGFSNSFYKEIGKTAGSPLLLFLQFYCNSFSTLFLSCGYHISTWTAVPPQPQCTSLCRTYGHEWMAGVKSGDTNCTQQLIYGIPQTCIKTQCLENFTKAHQTVWATILLYKLARVGTTAPSIFQDASEEKFTSFIARNWSHNVLWS